MADQMAAGLAQINQMRNQGASDQEIADWTAQRANLALKNGYSPDEIRAYFGQKTPDFSDVTDHVKGNLASLQSPSPNSDGAQAPSFPVPQIDASKPVEAKDMISAMEAGWQHGFGPLFSRGKKPDMELSPDAGLLSNFAYTAAQTVGDLPAMFAGATAGTALGGPGLGTAAGAFAAPAALRKMLMDHYEKGDIQDAGDFANRAASATWEAIKGAATGVATEATAGNFKALNAFGSPIIKSLTGAPTRIAAEAAAQSLVSQGLEGHLPNLKDFENGAIAIGGLHAVTAAGGRAFDNASDAHDKLVDAYIRTGVKPADVIDAVKKDPTALGELLSDNPPEGQEKQTQAGGGGEPPDQTVKPGWELPEEPRKEMATRFAEPKEESDESLIEKGKQGFLSFYVNTFDKTAQIARILKASGQNDLSTTGYLLARTFADVNFKIENVLGKWDQKSDTVTGSTLNGKDNSADGGETAMHIIKDYVSASGDKSLNNLKYWWVAAHNLELDKRGIEQPGSRENDQQIFDAGQEKYEPYVKRFVDFQNKQIAYARDKSLLSDAQYDAMVSKNQYYLPLHKVVEADDVTGAKAGSGNSLKRIGSVTDMKLVDPIDSIYKNTEILIRAADRNELIRKTVGDLESSENADQFIGKGPTRTRVTNVQPDELSRALEKQGWDVSPGLVDGFNVFRRDPELNAPGVISFRDNGDFQTRKVDQGLADVLNSYSENPQAMGMFTRMFRTAAMALRAGTIQNPLTFFFGRHSIRNLQQGIVMSGTDLAPFDLAKTATGLMTSDADKALWDKLALNGAFVHSMAERNTSDYFTDSIQRMDKKMPFVDWAWNRLDNVLNFSHAFIMANDNMIRFAEAKNTLAKGGTFDEALLNSRDVLADFQKEGLKRSALQATTAFFKAHYQGEFQLLGALSDPDKRLSVLARNIGYITVPSIMLGLAQADDKRIGELPDWLKWNYWNFHISNWRDATLAEAMSQKAAYPDEVRQKDDGSYQVNDGYVFRVPKPFANGMLFGSSFEEMMRDYRNGDPEHFAKFLANVGEKMLANPIPTAMEPVLEQMSNRDFFGGRQLVRSEMERNKLPEMQYTLYTSNFAKMLGHYISYVPLIRDIGPKDAKLASPIVIENYIKAYTGGSGKYLLSAIDTAMGKVVPTPPRPEMTWGDTPFVKEFLVRHDIESQPVQDFMDRQELANQVQGSIKAATAQGDMQTARDLQTRYATEGYKIPQLQQGIRTMMSAILKIQAAPASVVSPNKPDLAPVVKRQLIDGLNYQIISAARHGNDIMDKFAEQMKNVNGGK